MARGKKKENLTLEEKLAAALVPEDEQPYELPENWCWTSLSQIANWGSGGTPSRKKKEYYNGDILWIKTGELEDNYIYDSEEKITEEAVQKSSAKLFPADSVLIAMYGATIGKTAILGISATTNQACACAQCKEGIFNKYLFLYLQSQKDSFIEKGKGGAQPNISQEIIKKHSFPLPPLAEQHRIVERIESLFSKLDEARDKAQEALDGFEKRKESMLHKAFSGELTKHWRKQNRVSFTDWNNCKLIDLLVDKPRNGFSPKPVDYITPYKSMTLSATSSGVFMPEYYKYIDEDISDDSYLWLKPGDILIQRANSLDKVGMSAIYTGNSHEFIYPDLIMKLQVKAGIMPEYVAYQLKTDEVLKYFRVNATGTAGNMPKINQKIVCNTPVIVPSIQEQKEIVRILNDVLGNEKNIKEVIIGIIEQIESIKKSILAKAFRGKLGTNDLADESAIILVKEIMN